MAACGMHGRIVVNDAQLVINNTTNLSKGLPVINNTSTIKTQVNSCKLLIIRNQYNDDLCGQQPVYGQWPVWLSSKSRLWWSMWLMTCVINNPYGQRPVWSMTYVVDDLYSRHVTLYTIVRNSRLQME